MKETKNATQEAGISCKAMLELMGLPADAKKKLAVMLMDGELDDQAEQDHRIAGELIDPLLELSLHIKRMRAVAECFADDYVDTMNGITCAMAVANTEEHYESLFNAFFCMMADIDREAEHLQKTADQLFHDTLARI